MFQDYNVPTPHPPSECQYSSTMCQIFVTALVKERHIEFGIKMSNIKTGNFSIQTKFKIKLLFWLKGK